MRASRGWLRLSLISGIGLLALRQGAAQSFSLGFERGQSPNQTLCVLEDVVIDRVYSTLTGAANPDGAQAWSIGVRAPGHRVIGISLDGTAAAPAFEGGFVHNEVLTGEGNEGAVSIVWLSLSGRFTLPTSANSQRIAAFDVEAKGLKRGDVGRIEYIDGLRSAAGQVTNSVTARGQGFLPTLAPGSLFVTPPVSVGFALSDINSDRLWEGMLGGATGGAVVEVPVDPDGTARTHVFPTFVHQPVGDGKGGVQGYSISVAFHGDDVDIESVTEQVATVKELFNGGFRRTEIVDPAKNNGGRGFVSSMLYTFTQVEEAYEGTFSMVDLTLTAMPRAHCGGECLAKLSYVDRLRGSGQPVENNFTIAGTTVRPCNPSTNVLTLRFVDLRQPFVRGEADGDSRLDLSDAIFLIDALLRGGPRSGCIDAEDANDDGRVNIADAVYLIHFLFYTGEPPPAPFPDCGLAPADSTPHLPCETVTGGCS